MDSTNKSNVLKVFRFAILSNINYHSIEYILIGYKSKTFVKIFHQVFSKSTDFQRKDGQQIKILHLKYLESQ